MIGLGTLINTGAIIVGGILGLFAGKLLTDRFQKILTVAMGLSVIAMSLSDLVAGMLRTEEGGFATQGTYCIIFSLVLGGLSGELLDLDGKLERFGRWLREKTGNARDAAFVDAFVTTSLTVCIGAMAIVGALRDGLTGDYSVLLIKSILDFVIVLVMSASAGKGSIFSAIPVFVLQGSVTLLARLVAPLLSDPAMNNLSVVGSLLILCIGVNLMADGKYRIKVANLLPAVIFAVIAAYIPFLQ